MNVKNADPLLLKARIDVLEGFIAFLYLRPIPENRRSEEVDRLRIRRHLNRQGLDQDASRGATDPAISDHLAAVTQEAWDSVLRALQETLAATTPQPPTPG